MPQYIEALYISFFEHFYLAHLQAGIDIKGEGGGECKPSIEWDDYRNLNFRTWKTKNLGLQIYL